MIEVTLGVALALALTAVVVAVVELASLSRSNGARVDQLVLARDELAKQQLTAERATFETARANDALAAERRTTAALTGWIRDESTRDHAAPLDPRDVHGRVLRLAAVIAGARDPDVPAAGAGPGSGAADVPAPVPPAG